MLVRGRAARRAFALVLVLGARSAVASAQTSRDTLQYSVLLVPKDRHLGVEARITGVAGTLVLASPPASGPASTNVIGLIATDDRGVRLELRRAGSAWFVTVPAPGAVRFRYVLSIERSVSDGSTATGMDSSRLYAVTRSLFVAPDPTAYRKTGRSYPAILVHITAPEGWRTLAGWSGDGEDFRPLDGDDLLGATLAAAPDFRMYHGTAGGATWRLAIRGRRYFPDSVLSQTVDASLGAAASTLGPSPVPAVLYISDVGRKGRTSGSLQGHASIGLVWEPGEVLEIGRAHDLFHETLHLWFGGRIETERWWIEGVTDYFAARLYATWQNRPEDLAHLCWQSMRNYQKIEHRTRLTMAQENRDRVGGDNTELLVYRKGMLAGLLLDAAIRRGTNGSRSLDDLARRLLAMAAPRRAHYVRETELHDAAIAIGGDGIDAVWNHVVETAELLSEDEVESALQTVTGRPFAPPPLAKTRKELSR